MAHARVYSVLRRSACTLSLFSNPGSRKVSRALPFVSSRRSIQTTQRNLDIKKPQKALAVLSFDNVQKKEKETYLDILHMYEAQEPMRRGHVEFIKVAMNYMEEFGVAEDLEVYKKLLDILPKGKFISSSPMHADFMHYPKQQQCIVDLLEKMECNGVIGDYEMQEMLLNIFGQHGIPLRKFWRMMYWMPKFKNLNPWPTPRPVPTDSMVLAKIAVEKMTSVDPQSEVTVFETKSVADSIDDTWIVSGMSPDQQELLTRHPPKEACFVEGPFKIWVAHMPVDYFVLCAEPRQPVKTERIDEDDVTKINVMFWDKPLALDTLRSVHDQEDSMIYAVCATGTSSKDSLLSWIRCLQRTNPILEKIPVLFKLTKQIQDQGAIEGGGDKKEDSAGSEPVRKIGDN